jgi:hypothetical protein
MEERIGENDVACGDKWSLEGAGGVVDLPLTPPGPACAAFAADGGASLDAPGLNKSQQEARPFVHHPSSRSAANLASICRSAHSGRSSGCAATS